MAEKALTGIMLDDRPWAVEWLRRPTICGCCKGTGVHAQPILLPNGSTILSVYDCGTCVGQGYGVWFSVN